MNTRCLMLVLGLATSACTPAEVAGLTEPPTDDGADRTANDDGTDSDSKDGSDDTDAGAETDAGGDDGAEIPVDLSLQANHQYEFSGVLWRFDGEGGYTTERKRAGYPAVYRATFGHDIDDDGNGTFVWITETTYQIFHCRNSLTIEFEAFEAVDETFSGDGSCSARYHFYEHLDYLFREVRGDRHEWGGMTTAIEFITRPHSGNPMKVFRLHFDPGHYIDIGYRNRPL